MVYKAGDKVWATFRRGDLKITGEKAAVVTGVYTLLPDEYTLDVEGVPPPINRSWHGHKQWLRPRHDPYEGDQAGDWDSCPFKPELEKV